jgi:hypothetical protein
MRQADRAVARCRQRIDALLGDEAIELAFGSLHLALFVAAAERGWRDRRRALLEADEVGERGRDAQRLPWTRSSPQTSAKKRAVASTSGTRRSTLCNFTD